jgi:cobalt/nickel transport system ATP-binding protein
MSQAIVETRGLGYSYASGRVALHDVSLHVHPGERVGLVGPNGSGKSTLLLLLTGALRPSQGELELQGAPVTEDRLPELHRRVGLVFQHAADMLFTTRVRDDVAFGPRQLGLPEDQVQARVTEALESVGATRLADRVPHHLSAGEKRSSALAAVLAMKPDALLLDEPTSDLDPRGRRALLKLLLGLERTLFVASHDLEFVLALCTRVLVLDEGRIVADGEPTQVLGDEALMLAHGLERPHSLVPHHGAGHSHESGRSPLAE